MTNMKKYIIDTDIGDDIDDALAIHLALRFNLNLVAVTTVYRNTVDRARMAKRQIALYGNKKIPVYFGYGSTLDGRNESFPLCQWTKEIQDAQFAPDNTHPEQAVDLILDCARKYGKDFVLLAVGPLTNVARAIQKDPEAMKNSGGIILMGGDFVNDYAEWNILCDVTAANIVFSSDVDVIAFGHEMTSKTRLSDIQQNKVFSLGGSEYNSYLAQITKLWHLSKEQGYTIILHDLLVIRYVLDPSYCTLSECAVKVQTDALNRAKMKVDTTLKEGKRIQYACSFDEHEFIEYFIENIG